MLATAADRMAKRMAEAGTEVRVTRAVIGTTTYDPTTGNITAPPPTVIYEGPALVSPVGDRVAVEVRGGEDESMTRYQCSVPLSSDPLVVGDEVVVTADPVMVGLRLWVSQLFFTSGMSRRRFIAEQRVVAPRG